MPARPTRGRDPRRRRGSASRRPYGCSRPRSRSRRAGIFSRHHSGRAHVRGVPRIGSERRAERVRSRGRRHDVRGAEGDRTGRAGPRSRAALSPDGLRLVLLGADWRSFVVMERTSRTDSFMPSDESSPAGSAFAKLNAAGAALGPDEAYDDPVFGADGETFLCSVVPGGGQALRVSTSDTQGVWQVGTALDDCELQSLGQGMSRRPTGLTADGRTLFYFDEVRGIARAAFRGTSSGAFTSVRRPRCPPRSAGERRLRAALFVAHGGHSRRRGERVALSSR